MTTFEKESQSFQDENYHAHLDRNWQSGNKKLEAQDERINKLGNIRYYGANEVTQARTGVDGKQHQTLASRMDDMELETQNARGQFENVALRETDQDNQIQTAQASVSTVRSTASYAIELAKSASSGSPRGFFENEAALKAKYPNGASGVYVTKDNSHIWFYNSAWQDVGIYQGTEVSDKSITDEKFSNLVKLNTLRAMGGKMTLQWTLGYVTSKNKQEADGTAEGTISTNKDYSLTQPIFVHAGDLICVYGYIGTYGSMVSMWDVNLNYVSSLKDGLSTNTLAIIRVPQTGFIRVSNKDADFDKNNVVVQHYPELSKYGLNGWTSGELSWHALPLLWETRTYVGSEKNSHYPNQLANSSGIAENYTTSMAFGVNSGTVVTVRGGISANAYLVSEFDRTGTIFKGGLLKGTNKSGTFSIYLDHSTYIRISNNTDTESNPKVTTMRTNSPLAGRSINMFGDSYVKNNTGEVEQTWHYKLAQKYGMTYRNYGQNGNGMVSTEAHGTPMVDRVDEMDSNADYVIAIGGKNDYNKQITLDEFRKGVQKLITELSARFPAAKLAFMTPWSVAGTDNKPILLSEYAQVIEDECEFYGIPCFNSNKQSGIRVWEPEFRKKYMQSKNDVSHLNDTGHDRFLPMGEDFIKSL